MFQTCFPYGFTISDAVMHFTANSAYKRKCMRNVRDTVWETASVGDRKLTSD